MPCKGEGIDLDACEEEAKASIEAMVMEIKVLRRQANADWRDARRYRAMRASGKYAPATFGDGWALACGNGRWTEAELDEAADRCLPANAHVEVRHD